MAEMATLADLDPQYIGVGLSVWFKYFEQDRYGKASTLWVCGEVQNLDLTSEIGGRDTLNAVTVDFEKDINGESRKVIRAKDFKKLRVLVHCNRDAYPHAVSSSWTKSVFQDDDFSNDRANDIICDATENNKDDYWRYNSGNHWEPHGQWVKKRKRVFKKREVYLTNPANVNYHISKIYEFLTSTSVQINDAKKYHSGVKSQIVALKQEIELGGNKDERRLDVLKDNLLEAEGFEEQVSNQIIELANTLESLKKSWESLSKYDFPDLHSNGPVLLDTKDMDVTLIEDGKVSEFVDDGEEFVTDDGHVFQSEEDAVRFYSGKKTKCKYKIYEYDWDNENK